jgi:hypothetical protein
MKKINWESISEIYEDILDMIHWAEEFIELSGNEKKDVVISKIMEKYNISWLPDILERQVYSVLIDMAISILNKYVGHDWIDADNPGN